MAERQEQKQPRRESSTAAAEKRSTTVPAAAACSGVTPPCGACKFLRRKCVSGCVFAPYFGSDQGAARFAAVHKVFGASNVSKLLLRMPPSRRHDAVLTVSYEAQARLSDPVYGCISTILALQHQVASLQAELSMVQTQLNSSRMAMANQQQHNHFLLLQQQQQQCHHHHHLVMQQPAYSNNSSASTHHLIGGFAVATSFDLGVTPLSSDHLLSHPTLQPQTPPDEEDESRSISEAAAEVFT